MFVIVGLGNPGVRYFQTRHNAGFLTVDQIAEDHGVTLTKKAFDSLGEQLIVEGQKVLLVKPQTYMNLSGQAVQKIVNYYKVPLEKLLVIHDDLDLPLGSIRFRKKGSAAGQKGLGSIIQLLGTDQVIRLKIGIDRPVNGQAIPDYVLEPFRGEAEVQFAKTIQYAAQAAVAFVTKGLDYSMNNFNGNINEKEG